MVLVEGMFIFKNSKLRDLFDFKIFVEVDDDIRLSRMGNIVFYFHFLVLYENKYLKNNSAAFKSFFIIYEKYIKTSYETNVEMVNIYIYLICRLKNMLI